jgi:hypothetical protein
MLPWKKRDQYGRRIIFDPRILLLLAEISKPFFFFGAPGRGSGNKSGRLHSL